MAPPEPANTHRMSSEGLRQWPGIGAEGGSGGVAGRGDGGGDKEAGGLRGPGGPKDGAGGEARHWRGGLHGVRAQEPLRAPLIHRHRGL